MSNISRSKSNQSMKFGQLIEHKLRNICFCKIMQRNVLENLLLDPFPKIQIWTYFLVNSPKVYTVYFFWMPSWGLSNYMKTELLLPHVKLFKKLKRSLKLVFWPHFLHIFLKKSISIIIFYWLIKFHCLVAFTSWDIGQYMYCNYLLTRLWRHKFWNQIYLSNKVTFSI